MKGITSGEGRTGRQLIDGRHGRKKIKGGKREPPAGDCQKSGLQGLNVGSLQALGATDNLKFNGLTVRKGAVAVGLDGREMDENVLAALALDETKAFAGVKPLDCTLFFHRCVPLNKKSYLMHCFSGCHFRGKPGVFR